MGNDQVVKTTVRTEVKHMPVHDCMFDRDETCDVCEGLEAVLSEMDKHGLGVLADSFDGQLVASDRLEELQLNAEADCLRQFTDFGGCLFRPEAYDQVVRLSNEQLIGTRRLGEGIFVESLVMNYCQWYFDNLRKSFNPAELDTNLIVFDSNKYPWAEPVGLIACGHRIGRVNLAFELVERAQVEVTITYHSAISFPYFTDFTRMPFEGSSNFADATRYATEAYQNPKRRR